MILLGTWIGYWSIKRMSQGTFDVAVLLSPSAVAGWACCRGPDRASVSATGPGVHAMPSYAALRSDAREQHTTASTHMSVTPS